MTAAKMHADPDSDVAMLNEACYAVELCLTDFGGTAVDAVRARLQSKNFECVVIGAGLRTIEPNFLLFEIVLNAVHEFAPQARICFNTGPHDTAAAVQRWV